MATHSTDLPVKILNDFVQAVQTFASCKELRSISDHLDGVGKLHNDLASYKTVLTDLEQQKAIKHDEVVQLTRSTEELRDENTRLLQDANELREIKLTQEETIKKAAKKVKELHAQIKRQEVAIADLKEAESVATAALKKQDAVLQQMQTDRDKATANAQQSRTRLATLEGFGAPLSDTEVKTVAQTFDAFWDRATELVVTYFYGDLPDTKFKDERIWDRLRRPEVVQHAVPLPRSNSLPAKEMRIAVILAIMARLLDEYVFHPNYLFEGGSDTRMIFLRVAMENSEKESFCRALLASSLVTEQEQNLQDRISRTVADMLPRVIGLLPEDQHPGFQSDFTDLVHEACQLWRAIKNDRKYFEPHFDHSPAWELEWYSFRPNHTNGANAGGDEQRSQLQSKPETRDDPGVLVVFPRLCVVIDNTYTSVGYGGLLRSSQVEEAIEEVDREESNGQPPSPTQGRSRPLRPNPHHGRRGSTVQQQRGLGVQTFLG